MVDYLRYHREKIKQIASNHHNTKTHGKNQKCNHHLLDSVVKCQRDNRQWQTNKGTFQGHRADKDITVEVEGEGRKLVLGFRGKETAA